MAWKTIQGEAFYESERKLGNLQKSQVVYYSLLPTWVGHGESCESIVR
jgi:hypothetical protein